MWAMMPMLRVLLSGDCLAISKKPGIWSSGRLRLPAVVRERLVGFRHAMHVFALLHGAAAQVARVEQLVGQLFLHRLPVAAFAGVADQPADAERQAAVRI